MKLFSTLILCIWMVGLQAADNDKQRPSWSQGLPEKKDAPEFNKPEFEMDAIEIERPTFDTDLIKPKIQYSDDLNTTENAQKTTENEQLVGKQPERATDANSTELVEKVAVPEATPSVIAAQTENKLPAQTETVVTNQQAQSNLTSADSTPLTESGANQQSHFYSWEITRQLPIEVSSRLMDKQSSILLKIFINAKGDVIAVEPVLNDTPQSLINLAERSIKRWKFVPPQSQGFKQQVLSRVFKVALSEKS